MEVPPGTLIPGAQQASHYSLRHSRHAGGICGRIHTRDEIQQILQQENPEFYIF